MTEFVSRGGLTSIASLLAKMRDAVPQSLPVLRELLTLVLDHISKKEVYQQLVVDAKQSILLSIIYAAQALVLKPVCCDLLDQIIKLSKAALASDFAAFDAVVAVLNAYGRFYVATNEPRLFASLIRPLKIDPPSQLVRKTMRFINTLVSHSGLDQRRGLRAHFERLGLAEVLARHQVQSSKDRCPSTPFTHDTLRPLATQRSPSR